MAQFNILAIGNSFSEDATAYLKKIADSAGKCIKVVNLYIGGCSIATHWSNVCQDKAAYQYQLNGICTERAVSIAEMLREESWDIVTIQQASHDSGIYETYADGPALLEYIKENCPEAKIYFHKTWSYEIDSCHPEYSRYDRSQKVMDEAISNAAGRFCEENGLPCIPAGDVIAALREKALFDYAKGGQSLCRDGFHMHLIYGRYAVAAAWYQTLLGDIGETSFCPSREDVINGYERELPEDLQIDQDMICVIRETALDGCKKNWEV